MKTGGECLLERSLRMGGIGLWGTNERVRGGDKDFRCKQGVPTVGEQVKFAEPTLQIKI